MSRFLGRVGIGFFVSLPVVWFLAGGVQEGFFLLLFSIVCTAGVGLVAWIPAWWVVGSVTLAVAAWIHNKSSKVEKNPVSQPTFIPSRGDLALKAYIKHATATGMDADVMVCRLHLNGWNMAQIQSARQSFISSK